MVSDDEVKARLEEKRFVSLKAAIAEGRVRMLVDFQPHNGPRSPLHRPWENVIPMLLLVMFSLTLLIFKGVIFGTVGLLVAVLVYVFGVRPWVAKRIQARVREAALENLHDWNVLWKFGGLAVALPDKPQIGCVSPDGDWRLFVRSYVADPGAAPAGGEKTAGGGGSGGGGGGGGGDDSGSLSPFGAPKPRAQTKTAPPSKAPAAAPANKTQAPAEK
ncbi:MAG: hypothetical protein H7840_14260 [Alphaproteobacteria bacterium]